MEKNLTVSLIITTYNYVDALRLCLLSVKHQTFMPDEVIIADDGSRKEPRDMVENLRSTLPYPIKYVWQEDKGFRRAAILNRAFVASESDYIIQIDGDLILDRHFVEDHVRHARKGYHYNGSRTKITERATKRFLKMPWIEIHPWTYGVNRKGNALRIPFLAPLFYREDHCRGCNMAFWRDDILRINGYDEGYVRYGKEDADLNARLDRAGVRSRHLKFCAIQYHLYHPEHETFHDMSLVRSLFAKNNKNGVIRVEKGINQYREQCI